MWRGRAGHRPQELTSSDPTPCPGGVGCVDTVRWVLAGSGRL